MFVNVKRTVMAVSGMILLASLGMAQDPASAATAVTSNPGMIRTSAKPTRGDDEILKCIQGKLANSEKLRVQEFAVTVSNSEATFTGAARNAGSKGAATRIGQSCGASKVTNKITAPAIPRPPRKQDGNGADNR